MSKKDLYRDAGVDIDAGNDFVRRIGKIAKGATRSEVVSGIGGFGGLFRMPTDRWKKPLLVSATDGVGTKLLVAQAVGDVSTVGIDLVAMCANDLIVTGAEPLFFLDYLSCGRLDSIKADDIIEGVVEGCRQASMALLGGETAEMPGAYGDGEFDLAGFAVGAVDEDEVLDHTRIRNQDVLIGIPSSGLHSNGYSLVRKLLLEGNKYDLSQEMPELGCSLGEELLRPTKIYVDMVQALLKDVDVHALAHITGGGLTENVPRVLPPGCTVSINLASWPIPPIFRLLQRVGEIADDEMFRVFNCGVGMVVIVSADEVDAVREIIERKGERAFEIGRVQLSADSSSLPSVQYVGEHA